MGWNNNKKKLMGGGE